MTSLVSDHEAGVRAAVLAAQRPRLGHAAPLESSARFRARLRSFCAAGWPVLLRETGGEPVPQSASTINIALVYAPPRSEGDLNRIETGYRRLCDPICQLLDELGGTSSVGEIDGAFCDGRFNVNLDGRKMVGTAQRWRQSHGQRPVGLVHGAMLLDNERESMVAAVNRFNEACGLEQRVRAESHIACMKSLRQTRWSVSMNCIDKCWRSCSALSGYRRPPWSCL
jgi:lipoate-protein ligase A